MFEYCSHITENTQCVSVITSKLISFNQCAIWNVSYEKCLSRNYACLILLCLWSQVHWDKLFNEFGNCHATIWSWFGADAISLLHFEWIMNHNTWSHLWISWGPCCPVFMGFVYVSWMFCQFVLWYLWFLLYIFFLIQHFFSDINYLCMKFILHIFTDL